MRGERPRRSGRAAGAVALLACAAAVACGASPEGVHVVAAASLRPTLERLSRGAPGVRLQTGGSLALARRVVELELDADIVLLADLELVRELLLPRWSEFALGTWSDRLVLAGSPALAERLHGEPWRQLVRDPRVRLAMADPDTAPVGYRTLLALRLWDLDHPEAGLERMVRARVGHRFLMPDVAALLAPLQTGAVDAAFVYHSTALQAGLPFAELPAEINLGAPELASGYARAQVRVAGRRRGSSAVRRGAPIVYGAALRRGAGPAARRWFLELLGPRGRAAFDAAGFRVLRPPIVVGRPPDFLRSLLRESATRPR